MQRLKVAFRLKIILLQYFQFSIFSKISSIQTHPQVAFGLRFTCTAFAFFFFFFLEAHERGKQTCQWVPCTVHETHKPLFSTIFSLKMGFKALFTHLKIILLQHFQFSVFSFQQNKQYPNKLLIFQSSQPQVYQTKLIRKIRTHCLLLFFCFNFQRLLLDLVKRLLGVYLDTTYFVEIENLLLKVMQIKVKVS